MNEVEKPERSAPVILDAPERQNLLGLLLKNILDANAEDQKKVKKLETIKGDVRVKAGEMIVTLQFRQGTVTVVTGPTDSPRARVEGDMAAFLDIASGGSLISPFFAGSIKIGGNPFLLLKLLPFLKSPETKDREGQ